MTIKNMTRMTGGRLLLLAGLATLSLTGCKSLYGDYERPEVKTDGIVRDPVNDQATLEGSNDFGNLPWRSVFTDPQLQSLIEKALANNPNLLNAMLNVDIAESQLKAAKLAYLPSLVLAPTGTITHMGEGAEANKSYTLPLAASWNVDLFGTLRSSKKAAAMSLLQTKDYQLAVQTRLISNVANLYYTLLMLDKQLEIVNDMEGLTKDTWQTMQLLKDAKMGYRSTSVQAAESNYYSVLAQKADLKRQIRETENSLSLLLGEQAHAIARGKLDNQSLPANFSTGVGLQLLNNRADVHAAEMNLAQCFYGVETARSKFYPSITISGTGAFTNSAGAGIVNPGKWLLSAVGSLVQPIFQNGRLIAGLKVAKMQYEQAYNTWQDAVLKAGSEVSNALVLYNSSDEKGRIEAQQIEVLKQNVEDTRKLMGEAGGSYLEVIQAQSSLLNVQLSKVADDFYKMQAVVNLYYALGGGAK